jgi:hypothetical protein
MYVSPLVKNTGKLDDDRSITKGTE